MSGTGELVKVMITPQEGSGKPCTAMFNPKELTLTKTVSWTPATGVSQGGDTDQPHEERKLEYQAPQSTDLSVTLYFDTYEEKSDCYQKIKPLERMAMIDTKLRRPPLCIFSWGAFTFQGVVSSITQKYTMFLANGTRVRCEVALQMKSALEAGVSSQKTQNGQG